MFTDNQNTWIEWLQILPLIYSVLIIFVTLQICKEFKLQDRALLVVMTIVAFHPSLVFMAGSINNDGLSLLFQFLTVWFTLRWYRERNYKNIIGIALSISLGMLTKLSVGMVAIPVAFLFMYVLITEWQEKVATVKAVKRSENDKSSDAEGLDVQPRNVRVNVWKFIPWKRIQQYVVFGVVCVPIGLAWAVRCLIKFDMPLTYVNKLPEQSWQYVGDYSLWERFIPNVPGIINNLLHGSLGYGENVWVQLFRTAALGECDMSTFPTWGKLVAFAMMGLAFWVAIWAFVLMIRVLLCGKKTDFPALDMGIRCFWLIGYAVLFISYINFCYNFPHQCTMNFRYMVLTVLFPAVASGLAIGRTPEKKWTNVFAWLTVAYAVVSVLTIIVWCIAI